MKDGAREQLRQQCQQILSALGLEKPLALMDKIVGNTFDFTVEYAGDINFEILAKIADAFSTRDINLSCDLGCSRRSLSSDRSHDRTIYIKGAHPPKSS